MAEAERELKPMVQRQSMLTDSSKLEAGEDEFAEERSLFSIDDEAADGDASTAKPLVTLSADSDDDKESDDAVDSDTEVLDDSLIDHPAVDKSGHPVKPSKKERARESAQKAAKLATESLAKAESKISDYLQKRRQERIGVFKEERLLSVDEDVLDRWRLKIGMLWHASERAAAVVWLGCPADRRV